MSVNLLTNFVIPQTLLNYIISEGYHINEFKVLATFPRRDVSITQIHRSLAYTVL